MPLRFIRAAVPLTVALVGTVSACAGRDSSVNDTANSTDSSHIQSIRNEADSIARDMARELGATGTRQGTWTSADTTAEWLARMQAENPLVIEERLRMGPTEAITRVYFFTAAGQLEQISEQRSRIFEGRSPAQQASSTIVDFTSTPPAVTYTVNGREGERPSAEIEALRAQAARALTQARRAPDQTPQ